jgi:hypothetical protein
MLIVSEKSVDSAIDELNKMEENQEALTKVMEQFSMEQPAVFAYLMAMQDEFNDESFVHAVMYDTILLWRSFLNENSILPKVKEEKLVELMDYHLGNYEKLEAGEDDKLNSIAEDYLKTVAQPNLFRLIVEDIYGHDEEEEEESEAYVHDSGLAYMMLQIVLDSFDDAINGHLKKSN